MIETSVKAHTSTGDLAEQGGRGQVLRANRKERGRGRQLGIAIVHLAGVSGRVGSDLSLSQRNTTASSATRFAHINMTVGNKPGRVWEHFG